MSHPCRPKGRQPTWLLRSAGCFAVLLGCAKSVRNPAGETNVVLSTDGASALGEISVDGSLNPTDTEHTEVASEDLDAGAHQASDLVGEIEAVVINLDRRPDRMAKCDSRLSEYCPGLRYTRLPATDSGSTNIPTSEVAETWNTSINARYQRIRAVREGWGTFLNLDAFVTRVLNFSAGERGCASSHIRAWKHCVTRARGSNKPLLVLEDDAVPTDQFWPVLRKAMSAIPPDAHVLYLGYSQAADWKAVLSPELVQAEYVWTTVGYMLWPEGARILLSSLPMDQPVDNFMAALTAAGTLTSYCLRPKIVKQEMLWDVNSDIPHSDERLWSLSSLSPVGLLLVLTCICLLPAVAYMYSPCGWSSRRQLGASEHK